VTDDGRSRGCAVRRAVTPPGCPQAVRCGAPPGRAGAGRASGGARSCIRVTGTWRSESQPAGTEPERRRNVPSSTSAGCGGGGDGGRRDCPQGRRGVGRGGHTRLPRAAARANARVRLAQGPRAGRHPGTAGPASGPLDRVSARWNNENAGVPVVAQAWRRAMGVGPLAWRCQRRPGVGRYRALPPRVAGSPTDRGGSAGRVEAERTRACAAWAIWLRHRLEIVRTTEPVQLWLRAARGRRARGPPR
jgi:hypothetical protein